MTEIKKQVSVLMAAIKKKRLPSSEGIVDETFQKLGIVPGKVTPEFVEQNFNKILNQVWVEILGQLRAGQNWKQEIVAELSAADKTLPLSSLVLSLLCRDMKVILMGFSPGSRCLTARRFLQKAMWNKRPRRETRP